MPSHEAHSSAINPSELFGVEKGVPYYRMLTAKYPEYADMPIVFTAARAVHFALESDFELDDSVEPDMAVMSVIRVLESEVPAVEEVNLNG